MNKPKKITVGHYKGGILSLFNSNMKRLPDDSTEKIFSFKRVVFYILIIGSIVCIRHVSSKRGLSYQIINITWDPWWLGIFGVNTCGSNINLASIFAMIFGLSMGFGILVGLAGFNYTMAKRNIFDCNGDDNWWYCPGIWYWTWENDSLYANKEWSDC